MTTVLLVLALLLAFLAGGVAASWGWALIVLASLRKRDAS